MINKRIKIHKHSLLDQSELWIDGYVVKDIIIEQFEPHNFGLRKYHLISENLNVSNKIALLKLSEVLQANVISFEFINWTEIDFFSIDVNFQRESEERSFIFKLNADLLLWDFAYPFVDYFLKFEQLLEENSIGETIHEGVGEKLEIKLKDVLQNETIFEKINTYLSKIIEIHRKTLLHFRTLNYKDFVLISFKFPEKLKVSCEQYLLYFAQFLKDLGINADSDLNEEAGKVLFSVTPTGDVEALDKIREALAVYLNLPASPISDLEYSENFALMRLQQQVRNLQHSQQMAKTELLSAQYALSLAQNNIENQDQIIVRQHSTIENLNKVIEKITSNSIMTDSLDKKDKEEFEEICEGLRVGESKWLRELTGVGLSTGKFVKAIVKNTFGKEEKDSILGLDEE